MKRTLLLIVLAAAACGGKSPSSSTTPKPVGNDGPTTGASGSFWDVLATKGASWTLFDEMGEAGSITATVTDVIARDGGREIRLTWKSQDGEEGVGGPGVFFISDKGLFLDDQLMVEEPAVEIEEQTQENGRYVNLRGYGDEKGICFGFGPAPGAGECADVCYQEMCVAEKSGIISLDGLWAPNYTLFTAGGPGGE